MCQGLEGITTVKRKIQRNVMWSVYGMLWFRAFKRKNKLSPSTAVVVCPNNNGKCTEYAVRYLDAFLKQTHRQDAVLIVETGHHHSIIKNENIRKVEYVSHRKMKGLLQLYTVYCFYCNVVVASLYHPDVRAGERMRRAGKCTEEQLFINGIYNLDEEKI